MSDALKYLTEVYQLYIEIMRNPSRVGYILLYKKIKGDNATTPINLRLLDYIKIKDDEIIKIARQMLKKIGLDKLPSGIK